MNEHHHASASCPLACYNAAPPLTAEEENRLACRTREGDGAARDRLVRANLPLVANIARNYTARGLSLPDLIAAGNVGLLRAVKGYHPSMSTRFSAYATYWVRQAMKRAIIKAARATRPPACMARRPGGRTRAAGCLAATG
jgi:RNA polymerase primary sigma factor